MRPHAPNLTLVSVDRMRVARFASCATPAGLPVRSVTELLSDAKKRLEFMYSLIPRHKRPDFRKTAQTASATFVVKDGVVVDGRAVAKEKARYSNWGMGNLDPDDVARHDHQMRRFQFLDRPGGPPAGPVWD